ncbi:hypothetical protein BJF90_34545 [Pseudonocardia sp. CNS-004]|nr:hypothetical protein BJF90_34545 [Pseudonocardia sp. CNS-004]
MHIITDSTVDAPHPSWCSLPHCTTATTVDRRHTGAPLVLHPEQDDTEVSVAPVRDDELNHDGGLVSSTGGVHLRLTNLESVRAARRLHNDPSTIRLAAEHERLHGHQNGFGGRWLFNPAAVDAYVQGFDERAQREVCGCPARPWARLPAPISSPPVPATPRSGYGRRAFPQR